MAIEYSVRPCFSDHTEKGTYGQGNYPSLQLEGLDDEKMEYIFKHLAVKVKMQQCLEDFINVLFKRMINEKGLVRELIRTGSEYCAFYYTNPFGKRKIYICFNIHIDEQDRVWIDDCRVKTLNGDTVARFKQNMAADNKYVEYLS